LTLALSRLDELSKEFEARVSSKPTSKNEGDEAAKAFERAYTETHPNGPYPPVELKPKQQ
jgi:hypothetical protein